MYGKGELGMGGFTIGKNQHFLITNKIETNQLPRTCTTAHHFAVCVCVCVYVCEVSFGMIKVVGNLYAT